MRKEMEDGQYLSPEDKKKMESLKLELIKLKAEHKAFAARKGGLTPEDRELWRANSQRTNEVHIEIKDLRLKNVLEAGKG
jgi:hypothetical protein